MKDGYYWARHCGSDEDQTTFIVLLEDGLWFSCGVGDPINPTFSEDQIICAATRPTH